MSGSRTDMIRNHDPKPTKSSIDHVPAGAVGRREAFQVKQGLERKGQ
jgi:hypothetical protein